MNTFRDCMFLHRLLNFRTVLHCGFAAMLVSSAGCPRPGQISATGFVNGFVSTAHPSIALRSSEAAAVVWVEEPTWPVAVHPNYLAGGLLAADGTVEESGHRLDGITEGTISSPKLVRCGQELFIAWLDTDDNSHESQLRGIFRSSDLRNARPISPLILLMRSVSGTFDYDVGYDPTTERVLAVTTAAGGGKLSRIVVARPDPRRPLRPYTDGARSFADIMTAVKPRIAVRTNFATEHRYLVAWVENDGLDRDPKGPVRGMFLDADGEPVGEMFPLIEGEEDGRAPRYRDVALAYDTSRDQFLALLDTGERDDKAFAAVIIRFRDDDSVIRGFPVPDALGRMASREYEGADASPNVQGPRMHLVYNGSADCYGFTHGQVYTRLGESGFENSGGAAFFAQFDNNANVDGSGRVPNSELRADLTPEIAAGQHGFWIVFTDARHPDNADRGAYNKAPVVYRWIPTIE